jgi:hypothetical protein
VRDGVKLRRAERKSRRLLSLFAFAVLLLAAWVLATSTIVRRGDPGTVEATAPEGAVDAAANPDPGLTTVAIPKTDALERAAPPTSEAAAVEDKAAPELTDPVVVAGVTPSMGGTETVLSPTLVSRSVEPAAESTNGLVPLPPIRPRVVAIPLPRPRPPSADASLSGRAITDSEIFKQQTY